jgi:hypothetical protein
MLSLDSTARIPGPRDRTRARRGRQPHPSAYRRREHDGRPQDRREPRDLKNGANVTGFSNFEFSIGGKYLDLLKKAAPGVTRVAYMFKLDISPQSKFYAQPIEAAARSLGCRNADSDDRRNRIRVGELRASAERWADLAERQVLAIALWALCHE